MRRVEETRGEETKGEDRRGGGEEEERRMNMAGYFHNSWMSYYMS